MSEHRISVLLIEDNPIHARLIQNLLKESPGAGFDLTSADRLSIGLERLKNNHIDVILLDLVLPDSQEIETLVRVRAEVPDVPIVILTSLDDVTLAAKAVEAGAQDFLIKTDPTARC